MRASILRGAGKAAASVAALLLFLGGSASQGCTEQGGALPPGEPTATVAATSPPSPSATALPPRLPTAAPALPTSRFQFGKTVAAGDRATIWAGVSVASRYLKQLAGLKPPAVTVYAYVDASELKVPWEGIASAAGNSPAELQRDLGIYVAQALPGTVLVNTGSQQWKDLPAVHQLRLAAHEYFHAAQMDLIGPKLARDFYSGPIDRVGLAGPHWLVEGSAEYIGWSAMQSADLMSLDDHIAGEPEANIDLTELATFLDFYDHGQPSYEAALQAVYSLVRARGPASLVDYYRRIGQGQPWPTAFQNAFGISPAAFYELYSARAP